MKNCPFCGSEPEMCELMQDRDGRYIIAHFGKIRRKNYTFTYWVKCPKCHASTGNHAKTKATAIRRWNRRTA